MTRTPLFFLLAATTALAGGTATGAPTWSDDLAAAMAAADPAGGWQIAPIPATTAGARAKADILIEAHRDGSRTATYAGDITLKRGTFVTASPDGSQELWVAGTVQICDWLTGCGDPIPGIDPDEIDVGGDPLEGIEPDEIDFDLAACAYPLCGGEAELAALNLAYLVVDVGVDRDGTPLYTVRDMVVGIDAGFTGIEGEDID